MSVKKDFEISLWKKDPARIVKVFDKIIIFQEMEVRSLEVRQYFPSSQDQDKDSCLYTVFVRTNHGSVEMKYIESSCNSEELDRICFLLTDLTGINSLINRMLIELRSYSQ